MHTTPQIHLASIGGIGLRAYHPPRSASPEVTSQRCHCTPLSLSLNLLSSVFGVILPLVSCLMLTILSHGREDSDMCDVDKTTKISAVKPETILAEKICGRAKSQVPFPD